MLFRLLIQEGKSFDLRKELKNLLGDNADFRFTITWRGDILGIPQRIPLKIPLGNPLGISLEIPLKTSLRIHLAILLGFPLGITL